jgi:xylulokinase
VPLNANKEILAPSLLNFDVRGDEYLPGLAERLPAGSLYAINGNTFGNQYSLTKLMWIKEHQPEIYARTETFLHWSGWVAHMLGADAAIDFSLANRTLLFDIDRQAWSEELATLAGIDLEKLPRLVPAGTPIGYVSRELAAELGLPANVVIVSGAHDQCANAVGCGVIEEGSAVLGMGTYLCITPVFRQRKSPAQMLQNGLNTEHHAVPGCYVSFVYNQGGSMVKWYRDTFAGMEKKLAKEADLDIYYQLFVEIPDGVSPLIVLPHFAPTGTPHFISDTAGVIAGLKLETGRPEILKAILEGIAFYFLEVLDRLPEIGITIQHFRAAGGGSKSDRWIQICADIFGKPVIRPRINEAGALGAAILAGVGAGLFPSCAQGVEAMVKLDRRFEPDPRNRPVYEMKYQLYTQLYPLVSGYLQVLSRFES